MVVDPAQQVGSAAWLWTGDQAQIQFFYDAVASRNDAQTQAVAGFDVTTEVSHRLAGGHLRYRRPPDRHRPGTGLQPTRTQAPQPPHQPDWSRLLVNSQPGPQP